MNEATATAVSADGKVMTVQVSLKLRRRGGRKQIIAPTGMDEEAEPSGNDTLALTLARAHRWRDLLESGRCATIGELAREVGLDNSYLARQLRLTLLAPDIVASVLAGTEPDGLSLGKLYRLPLEWEEQRRSLGLSASVTPNTPA